MNDIFDVPRMISSTLTRWTMAICSSFVKLQIWQLVIRHSGVLPLAKSEETLHEPARFLNVDIKALAVNRNVDTLLLWED